MVRAQNLRQGIVMKTSFETRVLRMGLGSFVDINIFCCEILFNFSFFKLYIFLIYTVHKCYDPKKEIWEFRSTILF